MLPSFPPPRMDDPDFFSPGDEVLIPLVRTPCKILEGPNRKGQYRVLNGSLSIWVDAAQIRTFARKAKKRASSPPPNPHALSAGGTMTVDLHGMRVDEALRRVEQALDEALRRGCDTLEIIHGKGTGALREAAIAYLRRARSVKSIKVDEGNLGSTRVSL